MGLCPVIYTSGTIVWTYLCLCRQSKHTTLKHYYYSSLTLNS